MRKTKNHRWRSYLDLLKKITFFQAILTLVLSVGVSIIQTLISLLITSTGRVAITSSDYLFLLTTWQGWLIILLLVLSLALYVAFDINALFFFCSHQLKHEKISYPKIILESFESMKKFFTPNGLLVILFITLFVPLTGVGFSISLTSNFYIPSFITSVIDKNAWFSLAYNVVLLLLTIVAIRNLFLIPGVLFDNLSIKEAGNKSKRIVKFSFLKDMVIYIVQVTVASLLGGIVFTLIPMMVVELISFPSVTIYRFFLSVATLVAMAYTFFVAVNFASLMMIRLTKVYYASEGQNVSVPFVDSYHLSYISDIVTLFIIVGASTIFALFFDECFPLQTNVEIVAHRGGGDAAKENSLEGIEYAFSNDVYGSEIDIQRSKDGYYYINHDKSLERIYGVDASVPELTSEELDEIGVPTLEQALSLCESDKKLFVELKGSTADKQMADDIVQMVNETHTNDEVVLISLKYDLVDYIEKEHPSLDTGFLYYAAYGDDADLNCDYLIMEEESASDSTIDAIHDQGKKAVVWTVDELDNIDYFLLSDADAIITDRVDTCLEEKQAMAQRTDLERIWFTLYRILF